MTSDQSQEFQTDFETHQPPSHPTFFAPHPRIPFQVWSGPDENNDRKLPFTQLELRARSAKQLGLSQAELEDFRNVINWSSPCHSYSDFANPVRLDLRSHNLRDWFTKECALLN